jgi:hypothetical protein
LVEKADEDHRMTKRARKKAPRIAPRPRNAPLLHAEHFPDDSKTRDLRNFFSAAIENKDREIAGLRADIAARMTDEQLRQFVVGQIAEQIKQAAAPKPAPISLEQELGVIPGKPLSELGEAMQRVMAGEAAPTEDPGAAPNSDNPLPESAPVDDELPMQEHRQKPPTPIAHDWLARAAGKLTDGLFIGIGTVIGLMLGGVAGWKVWPWVDQITSL